MRMHLGPWIFQAAWEHQERLKQLEYQERIVNVDIDRGSFFRLMFSTTLHTYLPTAGRQDRLSWQRNILGRDGPCAMQDCCWHC